jgi:hypothetical protein
MRAYDASIDYRNHSRSSSDGRRDDRRDERRHRMPAREPAEFYWPRGESPEPLEPLEPLDPLEPREPLEPLESSAYGLEPPPPRDDRDANVRDASPAPMAPPPAPAQSIRHPDDRSSRSRQSPRRARPEGDATLYLAMGSTRSSTDIATSVRALSRAHGDNEATVIRIAKAVDGRAIVTPDLEAPVSREACDGAFRLLVLGDSTSAREESLRILAGLTEAEDPNALLQATLTLLHFTRGVDGVTRGAVSFTMLRSQADGTPWQLMEKVVEVGATVCAEILVACALHMSFGVTSLAGLRSDSKDLAPLQARVATQAADLGLGYAQSPLIEFDLGGVKAFAKMVVAIDDANDSSHADVFLQCIDTVAGARHARLGSHVAGSFRRHCQSIAHRLSESHDLPW